MKIISIMMYLLWALTILAVLAATFTDFKYEDLNAIAIVFFFFAGLNSYFVLTQGKKGK